MRATLGDHEVKYSWPLSEAIATAICNEPEPVDENDTGRVWSF